MIITTYILLSFLNLFCLHYAFVIIKIHAYRCTSILFSSPEKMFLSVCLSEFLFTISSLLYIVYPSKQGLCISYMVIICIYIYIYIVIDNDNNMNVCNMKG